MRLRQREIGRNLTTKETFELAEALKIATKSDAPIRMAEPHLITIRPKDIPRPTKAEWTKVMDDSFTPGLSKAVKEILEGTDGHIPSVGNREGWSDFFDVLDNKMGGTVPISIETQVYNTLIDNLDDAAIQAGPKVTKAVPPKAVAPSGTALFKSFERAELQDVISAAATVSVSNYGGILPPSVQIGEFLTSVETRLGRALSTGEAESLSARLRAAWKDFEKQQLLEGGLEAINRAQFGSIVRRFADAPRRFGQGVGQIATGNVHQGFRNIGGAAANVLAPVAKPILSVLEKEERFIGRPIANTLIFPFRPILPDSAENVLVAIGAAVLVPSTFLMPYAGRSITVASILSRSMAKATSNPGTFAHELQLAKVAIRAMTPNQAKTAGVIHVAARATAADPVIISRKKLADELTRKIGALRSDYDRLGDGETIIGAGGKRTTRENIKTQLEKVTNERENVIQEAVAQTRQRVDTLYPAVAATDPADMDRVVGLTGFGADVARTLLANKTIARFNPGKIKFLRKHIAGNSSELDEAARWLTNLDPPEHLIVKASGKVSKAEAALRTAENKQNWRGSLDWIENLMVEGAFDYKAAPPTSVFNWVSRKATAVSSIPIIGQPLSSGMTGIGALFQPLSLMSDDIAGTIIAGSRYRQAAIHAAKTRQAAMEMTLINWRGVKGLAGDQVLKVEYIGGSARSRAEASLARYITFKAEKGKNVIELSDATKANYLKLAEAEFDRGIGTILDAVQDPALYNLDENGKRTLKFVRDSFEADVDAALDSGVSMGRLNGDYFPRQRVAGDKIALHTGGRVVYPRGFKARKIEKWDDYTFAAAIDKQGIEYDLSLLIDWRLGQASEKKAFQAILRMMDSNVNLQKFVERPLHLRVGGPISKDELESAIKRSVIDDMPDEAAAAVARNAVEELPDTIPVKTAEFYLGREYRLIEKAAPGDEDALSSINKFFKGQTSVGVEEGVATKIIDFMRTALLSMDLSPIGFVQGARVFAQDPVSYVRAIGGAAAWNMTTHGRRVWAIQNAPALRFATARGLQMGNPFDIKLAGGLFGGKSKSAAEKVPLLNILTTMNREMMDAIGQAKLHLFNTLYATLLQSQQSPDIARLLRGLPMFKAVTKKTGWQKMNPIELGDAVAEGLNNYIGPIEFAKVVESGRPSLLEKFMLLTPSWTRGNIGMILNAPKAGPKGIVARHLFMNQMALHATMSTKMSLLLSGTMPSFDPTSTDFLAVQAPSLRFQLFPTMSAFRLPFRLLAGRPEAERFEEESQFETVMNEMSRFFEGRMGQTLRITADVVSGEDFLGRDIGPVPWFIAKESLPIIAQEIVESLTEGNIEPGEMAARTSLEFLGAAVIPKSPFQLYRERVELQTGLHYDDLNSVQLKTIERADPELQKLRERQHKYRARRGDVLDQLFNFMSDARTEANEGVDLFMEKRDPLNDSHFEADFARMSADSLASLSQENESAIEALFHTRREFEDQLRDRPAQALDVIARDWWGLDPNGFVDHSPTSEQNEPWSLALAINMTDGDSYRDKMWRAYRNEREHILTEGAKKFGLTEAEVRSYILDAWPEARWDNPDAGILEGRRVAADQVLDELFEGTPYMWPDGREFSREEFEALGELRLRLQTELAPLRARYMAAGQDLPTGVKAAITAQLASQLGNQRDKRLLYWQSLWEKEQYRDILRNPKRDEILINNPDVILFYPNRVRSLISSRLMLTSLVNDPKILDILNEALAR